MLSRSSIANVPGTMTKNRSSRVEDWLALLAAAQPAAERQTEAGIAQRTLALAVLRGALLDLLATGDRERTTRAVARALDTFGR